MKKVKKALGELGFVEKHNYFQREDCPWFVEFVAPPVAIGSEPIFEFNNLKTPLGTIKMLRVIDSVKDRLASFYHWDDKESLEQAIKICTSQKIELEEIEMWSTHEKQEAKYQIFKKSLQEYTK